MKHLKILFLLFSLQIVNAQVADTLSYVKQFEINKTNYIGKPFSVLLNDMNKIKIQTVVPESSGKSIKHFVASTFKFELPQNSFKDNIVLMVIEWKGELPKSDIKYYNDRSKDIFTSEEKNYYSNKIIRNIIVYKEVDD
ncbi:MAG: hypothetical protein ACRC8Z_06060 [Empedobacter falsenii]